MMVTTGPMACEEVSELTSQQRAALVVWLLARGHSFTTMEIAHITGLGYRGAKHMMDNISSTLPLSCEQSRWKLLTDKLTT